MAGCQSQERIQEAENAVERIFDGYKLTSTTTRSGWCLKEAMHHCYHADNGSLASLINRHGLPGFYSCANKSEKARRCRHAATQDIKDPSNCFESLCRVIAGQFVSGSSAQAAWKRLLTVTSNNLTPDTILQLAGENNIETGLQKPAGLTLTKARSIVDLATHFSDGRLSETLLTTSTDQKVRESLLKVKGIGPWSCDIFLLFYLERPDVLPLGDLGVRKGISTHFGVRGTLKDGKLCEKKDAERIQKRLEPFRQYHSLVSYYMWRAADTPANDSENNTEHQSETVVMETPKSSRRKLRPMVTPEV